ncbi:MAG TPA: carboxylating nicotinate-nucleotide diphosphorylase [Acidimicrobiia bacterium]|nr:carboxylating nicotinate-nucleotide diphosphorylase [Acidimicrobiia bacterium]
MLRADYVEVVGRALYEDLGPLGDITSDACVPQTSQSEARFVARAPGVIAGLDVVAYVFEALDPSVTFEPRVTDGDRVEVGAEFARIAGHSRSILTGERTALNLLGRMSGVATATAELVEAVSGTGAKISDTRKTVPGLRALDKYAVRVGGGMNHRFGLYDAALIKDNHLVAVGSITQAVAAVRERVNPGVMIEVEVESLEQLSEALETDADRVLLDNMGLELLRQAVALAGDRITTEASGGVTLENVRELAETGVDIISVGWITHSAPQLDIALDFVS